MVTMGGRTHRSLHASVTAFVFHSFHMCWSPPLHHTTVCRLRGHSSLPGGDAAVQIRVWREASTLSRLSRTQRQPRTPMHPALGPLGGRFSLPPHGHWYATTKMESPKGGLQAIDLKKYTKEVCWGVSRQVCGTKKASGGGTT